MVPDSTLTHPSLLFVVASSADHTLFGTMIASRVYEIQNAALPNGELRTVKGSSMTTSFLLASAHAQPGWGSGDLIAWLHLSLVLSLCTDLFWPPTLQTCLHVRGTARCCCSLATTTRSGFHVVRRRMMHDDSCPTRLVRLPCRSMSWTSQALRSLRSTSFASFSEHPVLTNPGHGQLRNVASRRTTSRLSLLIA